MKGRILVQNSANPIYVLPVEGSMSFGRNPFCDYYVPDEQKLTTHPPDDPLAVLEPQPESLTLKATAPSEPIVVKRNRETYFDSRDPGSKESQLQDGDIVQFGSNTNLRIDLAPRNSLNPLSLKDAGRAQIKAKRGRVETKLHRQFCQNISAKNVLKSIALLAYRILTIKPIELDICLSDPDAELRRVDHCLLDIDTFKPRPDQLVESFTEIRGQLVESQRTFPVIGLRTRDLLEQLFQSQKAQFRTTEKGGHLYFSIRGSRNRWAGIHLKWEDQVNSPSLDDHKNSLQQFCEASTSLTRYFLNDNEPTEGYPPVVIPKKESPSTTELIAESSSMQNIEHQLSALSDHQQPVLFVGELGTGKQKLARHLHRKQNPDEPFIKIDCRQPKGKKLDKTIFGSQNPANSNLQRGALERAKEGTLFLRHIDAMPPLLQGKLLRVLEKSGGRQRGSAVSYPTRCRLIASTHRDLITLTNRGSFRQKLHNTLKENTIWIPPLRERAEDIIPLTRQFVSSLCNKHGRQCDELTPETRRHLKQHRWPGNIEQLKTVLEAAILNTDPTEPKLTADSFRL